MLILLRRKKLAKHVWCDFFVGLARAVEEAQGALDGAKEHLRELVRSSILGSEPHKKYRKGLSSKLIDALVDKGWDQLIEVVTAHNSGLSAITKPDLLRSLRIMALFCFPAPERHPEVREHALKPLEEDVQDLLTAEVKDRLRDVVPEWQEGE